MILVYVLIALVALWLMQSVVFALSYRAFNRNHR